MQSKKRSYMPLTAFMMPILISMLMSVTACSSAEKTDNEAAVTAAPAEETAAETTASGTMQDGTYDCIMSGFCYSEERDISYDFTSPYYCRTIVATVREDSPRSRSP